VTIEEEDGHSSRVLIGVCTLNEADNIEPLIRGLRAALPSADVLIVDDDSSDGTGQIVQLLAQEFPSVRLHLRRDQRGLGTAIRHAMAVAIEQDYEYFLNLDGDLSHDPDQLPALLRRIQQPPPVDLVIGSRYVPGGEIVGWPRRRRILSRIVNRFAARFLRLPATDCSGSIRCYRVSKLREVGIENLHSKGYSFLEEILVQLHRQGATMVEVPITFTDRQAGKSKLTTTEAIRSAWQIVRLVR